MVIAQELSVQAGLTLIENARLFALLGLTAGDASILCWDNKYHFSHWRPVTAIRSADLDGNPATQPNPDWTPLVTTPPFPTYTSRHSTFSSACATSPAEFFGRDDIAFTTASESLPGVWCSFTSLSEAAEEAGRSRVYGGIHWQYDNVAAAGLALGQWVFANFLRPTAVHQPELPPQPLPLGVRRGHDALAE
jgi:membrane-associated phospholipid phosphatase